MHTSLRHVLFHPDQLHVNWCQKNLPVTLYLHGRQGKWHWKQNNWLYAWMKHNCMVCPCMPEINMLWVMVNLACQRSWNDECRSMHMGYLCISLNITVTSPELHGVSNHRHIDCLFNSMFKLITEKNVTLVSLCERNLHENFPHKGPEIQKVFPCHVGITVTCVRNLNRCLNK